MIEHNLDVIKTADWIIDLGPEGGDSGGQIIAKARRRRSPRYEASYTGRFLRGLLPRGRSSGRVAGRYPGRGICRTGWKLATRSPVLET